MANFGQLVHLIYHERQQPGSMLCAQHALNSLLQGNYFTAPDLSDIAATLDNLERQNRYHETSNGSANMDDTGFFSVQVLETALKTFGLNLVRWRGEAMRPYHSKPYTQLAFILNLDSHWFTLRRFGHAEPNVHRDPGNGHWFNLNSSFSSPEWVGKTYLEMVLQQAEADGYSVFVVTQADPEGPLSLPRTHADEIASILPEPTSAPRPTIITPHNNATSSSKANPYFGEHIPGFDDEDFELQAALQASLSQGNFDLSSGPVGPPPPLLRARYASLPPSSNPASGAQTPTLFSHDQTAGQSFRPSHGSALLAPAIYERDEHDDGDDHAAPDSEQDPVAAGMARNRLLLQEMQRQQEEAQRELWTGFEDDPQVEERRLRRMRREEAEEEQLRMAIKESEAMARREGGHIEQNDSGQEHEHDIGPSVPDYSQDRVYDDDDPELQAALRASLEQTPPGWTLPEAPPSARMAAPPRDSPVMGGGSKCSAHGDVEDSESILSEPSEANASQQEAESVSMEEMRRRRLARFGA